MSVLNNVDICLARAADKELEMTRCLAHDEQSRENFRRQANLYFKKAMKLEANDDMLDIPVVI